MAEFLAKLEELIGTINGYVSDYILLILLVATGLFFTIKTRFVQVRCFGEGMKKVFGNLSLKGGKQEGGLSSFQALATAIAAQVGTGNIVGACGAILVGGAGAIFWMWVIAFFGMATIYAEAVLAQKTRVVDENGNVAGGPVYYIKKAFAGKLGKILAGFFAVATVLALGFMGAMVQSNSISGSAQEVVNQVAPGSSILNPIVDGTTISVFTIIVGAVVAILAAAIFMGGVSRIASVTEKIVPIMAGLFLVGGLLILCIRIKYVPETIGMIFKYAFMPQALIGGGIGYALKTAISKGAQRGLFSNEAGMGSTPHAHALANVKKPHDQGVVAMIGVFIDTFVVLTMTALVVISCMYAGNGQVKALFDMFGDKTSDALELAGISNGNLMQKATGMAIGSVFGDDLGAKIGAIFIAVCLFFFAFSTIIGWNLFGKINFQYLFGKKALVIYTVISLVFIFLGACLENGLVWNLTDFFNYLMVIPNAIALIALYKLVKDESDEAAALKKAAKANQ